MMPERIQILSHEEEQRIRGVLAAAAETDGAEAPERVEKALLVELRRRNRRVAAGQIAVFTGLAAALLVGMFLVRPAAAPAPVARDVLAAAPTVAEKPTKPAVVKTVVKRPGRRPAPKPAKLQMAAAEPAEFIPVGPWQAMEPMERGSIIRVRLPKSALPGFGIPVSADRWNEFIPADVVLGEDGTMRAVRFVNTRR